MAHNAALIQEREGSTALNNLLSQAEMQSQLKLWFFNAKAKQLAGESAPKNVLDLLDNEKNSDEVNRTVEGEWIYITRPVLSPRGNRYILIAKMPDFLPRGPLRPQPTLIETLLRVLPVSGARLWIFLAGAGFLCYALARYLTDPVRQLRQATQQLAGGDLAVRVGRRIGRRGDELSDLGRDFDRMAERIQNLMLSERRLLGDISHELRSPLARLQVALDLAEQSATEENQQFLDRIRLESDRLNILIGQLLALARLESGHSKSREAPVNLGKLVQDIAQDADFEARSRNRHVKVERHEECQTAGSAELLRSAIENVVRNAVHYTNENSEVEVNLSSQNNEAVIRVRDHGPGVPPDTINDLFRPFYRVAQARDRKSGGVGLGLAIAERAVRAHGGSIKAENANGGGLQVEIRLPCAARANTLPA
jgi:two-component system sensor histidine kinase CpxA